MKPDPGLRPPPAPTELNKPQPPEELMDLLVLLYEFQNPRLTAEILSTIRTIRLCNVRMTPLKCFVLSSVLSCSPARYLGAPGGRGGPRGRR